VRILWKKKWFVYYNHGNEASKCVLITVDCWSSLLSLNVTSCSSHSSERIRDSEAFKIVRIWKWRFSTTWNSCFCFSEQKTWKSRFSVLSYRIHRSWWYEYDALKWCLKRHEWFFRPQRVNRSRPKTKWKQLKFKACKPTKKLWSKVLQGAVHWILRTSQHRVSVSIENPLRLILYNDWTQNCPTVM
jgi:hypothetical protein